MSPLHLQDHANMKNVTQISNCWSFNRGTSMQYGRNNHGHDNKYLEIFRSHQQPAELNDTKSDTLRLVLVII